MVTPEPGSHDDWWGRCGVGGPVAYASTLRCLFVECRDCLSVAYYTLSMMAVGSACNVKRSSHQVPWLYCLRESGSSVGERSLSAASPAVADAKQKAVQRNHRERLLLLHRGLVWVGTKSTAGRNRLRRGSAGLGTADVAAERQVAHSSRSPLSRRLCDSFQLLL